MTQLSLSSAAEAKDLHDCCVWQHMCFCLDESDSTVLLSVLDRNDNPPDWSVDVKAKKGKEYEVKVNAHTGKVIAIIPGG